MPHDNQLLFENKEKRQAFVSATVLKNKALDINIIRKYIQLSNLKKVNGKWAIFNIKIYIK